MSELTVTEKITATKIKMSDIAPFFSYIVEHLTFQPLEGMEMPTIAVNAQGHCLYDPQYLAGRNLEGMIFDLSHEAMHVALEHCDADRVGSRDRRLWNIAIDLVVNSFMLSSGVYTKEDGLIMPDHNGVWRFKGKNGKTYAIHNIHEKTAEDIYDFIEKNVETDNISMLCLSGMSKDDHLFSSTSDNNNDDKKSDKTSSMTTNINKKDWKSILAEAAEFAKNKGNKSLCLDRIVEQALKSKRNWRKLLYKYITATIPNDFTYSRPSKRFISTGMYFPATKRESISAAVAIDTSGSISQKELTMFLGEIYSILSQFQNVSLTYMMHDTKILTTKKFCHTDLHKLKKEKVLGGGGTSHQEIFDWAKKNRPETLICFTDGYSDIPQCKKYSNTIWMLTTKDCANSIDFGQKIFFDKYVGGN